MAYHSATTSTARASGGTSVASEDALLNSPNLACAATIGAGLGICPRLAANAMTGRTELDAGNFNFSAAAEYGLLEGESEVSL